MRKNEQRRIEVFMHWAGLPEPSLMGVLSATPVRGKEVFLFEYDSEWLKGDYSRVIDPQLGFFQGQQYAPDRRDNFGIFLDSAPDRWGRLLMRRREAKEAGDQKRKPRTLYESDYLLGVYDGYRMGALRFRLEPGGPFLDNNQSQAAPPWTQLRDLEYASLQLERDHSEEKPDYSKWLKMLIAPGASIGGARPKASVVDEKGQLWIAKFPSTNDEYDTGAWEYVVHELAMRSGIVVPPAYLKKFSGRHHTFLTRRFDRTDNNERLHFASAMTLLNHSDGDTAATGASYLEMIEFLSKEGSNVSGDLEQLWKRIVFNICVSNVDDHLRNHGFILGNSGWVLSPAYDMNPVPTGDGLHLNISDSSNAQDLSLALSVIDYFRLSKMQAEKIINGVVGHVKAWREVATALGISSSEQRRMKEAFRMAS